MNMNQQVFELKKERNEMKKPSGDSLVKIDEIEENIQKDFHLAERILALESDSKNSP